MSWIRLKYPGASKIKNKWFWGSWLRPLCKKTMKIKAFRVFPKSVLKVTSPKWCRIILRRCWAILSRIFTVKMIPPDPLDPKSKFCQISRNCYGKSVLFKHPILEVCAPTGLSSMLYQFWPDMAAHEKAKPCATSYLLIVLHGRSIGAKISAVFAFVG